MVGVGWSKTSALARVSLVDHTGQVVYDSFVQPPGGAEVVTDYRTWVSGVNPSDLTGAPAFDLVRTHVAHLLKGKVVVGHAVHNDFFALQLVHPPHLLRDTASNRWISLLAHLEMLQRFTLPPMYSRNDRATYTEVPPPSPADFVPAGGRGLLPSVPYPPFGPSNPLTPVSLKAWLERLETSLPEADRAVQVPSLKRVAKLILGRQVQHGGSHSSIDDARTTMQVFRATRGLWEHPDAAVDLDQLNTSWGNSWFFPTSPDTSSVESPLPSSPAAIGISGSGPGSPSISRPASPVQLPPVPSRRLLKGIRQTHLDPELHQWLGAQSSVYRLLVAQLDRAASPLATHRATESTRLEWLKVHGCLRRIRALVESLDPQSVCTTTGTEASSSHPSPEFPISNHSVLLAAPAKHDLYVRVEQEWATISSCLPHLGIVAITPPKMPRPHSTPGTPSAVPGSPAESPWTSGPPMINSAPGTPIGSSSMYAMPRVSPGMYSPLGPGAMSPMGPMSPATGSLPAPGYAPWPIPGPMSQRVYPMHSHSPATPTAPSSTQQQSSSPASPKPNVTLQRAPPPTPPPPPPPKAAPRLPISPGPGTARGSRRSPHTVRDGSSGGSHLDLGVQAIKADWWIPDVKEKEAQVPKSSPTKSRSGAAHTQPDGTASEGVSPAQASGSKVRLPLPKRHEKEWARSTTTSPSEGKDAACNVPVQPEDRASPSKRTNVKAKETPAMMEVETPISKVPGMPADAPEVDPSDLQDASQDVLEEKKLDPEPESDTDADLEAKPADEDEDDLNEPTETAIKEIIRSLRPQLYGAGLRMSGDSYLSDSVRIPSTPPPLPDMLRHSTSPQHPPPLVPSFTPISSPAHTPKDSPVPRPHSTQPQPTEPEKQPAPEPKPGPKPSTPSDPPRGRGIRRHTHAGHTTRPSILSSLLDTGSTDEPRDEPVGPSTGRNSEPELFLVPSQQLLLSLPYEPRPGLRFARSRPLHRAAPVRPFWPSRMSNDGKAPSVPPPSTSRPSTPPQ